MSDLQRIKPIFEQALDREGEDRRAFLDQVCGQEPELRRKVDALLRANESARGFLESPVFGPEPILDEPPVAEGPGTVIGRYKLLERIGEGGMAVVYMAEQAEPIRRKVALKIIKPGMDTKQVIARFEAERQVLAMMDHPNIAKVFDAGATETGRPYFVMELVTGVSITDYCDANRLGTRERLALFVQACHAVQHAHQKGIIHRDIKPSNVMVTMHDGKPVPKVIDFGIAKATNQRLTEKTLFTRYAQIIGTPAYMSPEQAELSDLDIDTRSDIYSLGVLLYELLAGTTPFSERQLREAGYAEMQRVIREEEPTKPSTKLSTLGDSLTDIARRRSSSPDLLRKALRGDLDWIVMKTLEKDRTRRYETATDLLGDVERHLHHEPVSAGPPSTWYRMTKFMQRRRKLVVASFAMLIVILMALFVSAWMYLQADLALRREIAARAETQLVSDFFTEDLLASVYPEKAKGPEVTVHYILDNAVKNLRQKLQDAPVSEAKVRSAIGSAYRKLGDYNAAEEHLKLAFKIYGAHLGREHPITLHSMLDLGSLYVEYGRFLESEPLLLEAIEMQTRVLGGHHADTLESMAMLGWQYTLAHTKPEADRLIDAVLHHGMRVLGEEHAIVLRAMSYRAYRLLYDRKYEEAEDLARKGLGISERLLGSEHERSIFFRNLITDVYQQTSRCELGTAWGSETLDMCERTLGDEHPQSLVAMRLLGDIYRFQGFPDQALPLLRKSTESCIRVLGEQHTFTLLAIFGLSEAYREMGQYEKCDDLICMGLRITDQLPASNKKQRNPNMWFRFLHPRDIRIRELRSLARTRFDAKDYEAALSAVAQQEKFLNVRSEKLEPQDLKLRVMSLSQLGDIRRAQQALRQLRIIYDEKEYSCRLDDLCQAERSCVERGDETYAIWELVAQGKWDEASNQFHTLSESQDLDTIRSKETFESLAKVLTRGHGTLARAASGQAEFGEAIHHYNEAIRIDPSNEVLLNELAVLLATCPFEKFRDGSRAVSLAQQLCEISNWDHAACLDTLACAYAETGDFTAASRYAKEAISKIGSGEQSLLNHVRKRLQLFQSEKSCRSCEPELVAWWPFELSDTGTVLDASGNAHDGRLQGDARITVDPDRGNVLSLSGDGYVDLDDDQVLDIGGATTVSLWILVEVVTQYHSTIIDIPIDGAGCPSVHLRHPGIIYTHYAGLTPEGGWPAVSTRDTYDVDMEWQYTAGVYDGIRRPMHVVADSSWHHIVSVYDGAKISLYLDGELFGSILATGSMSPGNSPICIGANSSTNNRFTGRLDDVRIYNYALTASQIKALWAEEKN